MTPPADRPSPAIPSTNPAPRPPMTENPINPAALYDYAASKNDMDSLRPEERTFLEACAWEWEKASAKPAPWDDMTPRILSDAQKALDALGEPTPAPSSPAAERAPVTCSPCIEHDHEGPPEDAAERADEGLEEEAEKLWNAFAPRSGPLKDAPFREDWINVARAARALRRGGDGGYAQGWRAGLEALISQVEAWHAPHHVPTPRSTRMGHDDAISAARVLIGRQPDSGASVVVDREQMMRWRARCYHCGERVDFDSQAARDAWNDGHWPKCGGAKIAAALADRDSLAAKLAEAEHTLAAQANCIALATTARAEAERLRGERDEAKADNERLRSEAPPRICECGHSDSKHGFYAGSHPTSCASGCACKKFVLRTAPPTVSVVDVEKAAERIAEWFTDDFSAEPAARTQALSILRDCTRAVSVEEVAAHVWNEEHARGERGQRWEAREPYEDGRPGYVKDVQTVLRFLGAREATLAEEQAEVDQAFADVANASPKVRVPAREAAPARRFVVDEDALRAAIRKNLSIYIANAASYKLPRVCAEEIERQVAEHAKSGAS